MENDFAPCHKLIIQCFVLGRVWGDERDDLGQFYSSRAAFKYTEEPATEAPEIPDPTTEWTLRIGSLRFRYTSTM
jgi:hypothetical protein